MEIGARVAEEALALLGVPFKPHGRDPETGLDCAGLVIHCYAAAGIEGIDAPYAIPRTDLLGLVESCLSQRLESVWQASPSPPSPTVPPYGSAFEGHHLRSDLSGLRLGDVLVLSRRRMRNHMAIYVGERCGVPFMVHAWDEPPNPRVVESPMGDREFQAIHSVWRFEPSLRAGIVPSPQPSPLKGEGAGGVS